MCRAAFLFSRRPARAALVGRPASAALVEARARRQAAPRAARRGPGPGGSPWKRSRRRPPRPSGEAAARRWTAPSAARQWPTRLEAPSGPRVTTAARQSKARPRRPRPSRPSRRGRRAAPRTAAYRPASRGGSSGPSGRDTSTASPRACRPGVCSARRRPSTPIERFSGPPPRTPTRAAPPLDVLRPAA